MKGDRIEIEDEWYLDTTAAAEKTGYTKDYVGQLARSGKIQAKQLGRAWYVHEESLVNHKKEIHDSPENEKSKSVSKSNAKKSTVTVKEKKEAATPVKEREGVDKNTESKKKIEILKPLQQEKVRVGAPETLGVNHQKISTTKDPLLHADISFQTDGPVLYGSEGAETGMIELQDKNVAPEVEEKPNDIVTKKQDARAVALYLNPKKTIHKKEEESSLEVYSSSAQKNTLRASLKVFFSRLGGVPHTTAVSFGVFVGCCAALFGLL